MATIDVEVDTSVNAAYVRLSNEPVARTVEFDELIMIDLDALNMVVGIEVLDEGTPLPFDALLHDYHVHTDVIELLRLIRPDVSSFLRLTMGTDGASSAQEVGQLVYS